MDLASISWVVVLTSQPPTTQVRAGGVCLLPQHALLMHHACQHIDTRKYFSLMLKHPTQLLFKPEYNYGLKVN